MVGAKLKRFAASIFLVNGEAWTTKNFTPRTYLGEPSNIIRILNELACDEVIVSSPGGPSEDVRLLTGQAFMPITYSGGIKSAESALQVIKMGVDKVGISTAAISDFSILSDICELVGQANTTLIVSVQRNGSDWAIWDWGSRSSFQIPLDSWIKGLPINNFSEMFIRSVDRDGSTAGPDLELIDFVRRSYKGNLVYGGGIASQADVMACWARGADCVASSTFLSTYGKYHAPLVGYSAIDQKRLHAN